MAIDLVNYEERARDAVQAFWRTREQGPAETSRLGKV